MFKKLLISAIMASTFAGVQAASVSGTTNFKVTVPEILVLYHWDKAHLDLTKTSPTGKNVPDNTLRTLQENIGETNYNIDGDVDTTDAIGDYLKNIVTVKLVNSWAVRAIAKSSNTVNLNLTTRPVLKFGGTDNTNKITISKAGLDTKNTVNKTIANNWVPTIGSIIFEMDMTAAKKAGTYQSATTRDKATDTFLLTLSTTSTP